MKSHENAAYTCIYIVLQTSRIFPRAHARKPAVFSSCACSQASRIFLVRMLASQLYFPRAHAQEENTAGLCTRKIRLACETSIYIHFNELFSVHVCTAHSGTDREKTVSLEVQTQVARFSMAGPPSFPPPPPPPPSEFSPSPPPEDHMYEVPPALSKLRQLSQEPPQEQSDTKAAAKVPVTTVPVDSKLDDDGWTPGYDVISKPKKGKKPVPGSGSPKPPRKQKSLPAESDQTPPFLPPPAQQQPMLLVKEERAKSSQSTVFERPPHLYEVVPDNVLLDETGQRARPTTVLVPMRRTHIYESAEEAQKQVRPKSRIPPRTKRPPPAPPGAFTPTKAGGNLPSIATDQVDSSNGVVVQPRANTNNHNLVPSPVKEIVSNPTSYLGTNLSGKRMTVDIQQPDEKEEVKEPVFLFSKGHSSCFIRVRLARS